MQLAIRFRWTPEQVNALDKDFLEELLAYLKAESRHEEQKARDAERKARQAGTKS